MLGALIAYSVNVPQKAEGGEWRPWADHSDSAVQQPNWIIADADLTARGLARR